VAPARSRGAGRVVRGLTGAVTFLTLMPMPMPASDEALDLGWSLPWFPLVGATVGAVGGGVRVALDHPLGPAPSSALAIAAMVAVTGALHQDALADTCDGLGVRGDRERRLAVMRDSTVGAFGVLAIVLWALVEFAALDGLTAVHALLALIAAGAASRLAAVLHGLLAPPARPDGLGAALGVSATRTLLAGVLAAVICIVAVGPGRGGLAFGVAVVVSGLCAQLARRAVGGSTGDTLGATAAIAEAAVCLALLASWR
jgi:adenosylcobinamide-GDP ribazoletransferase